METAYNKSIDMLFTHAKNTIQSVGELPFLILIPVQNSYVILAIAVPPEANNYDLFYNCGELSYNGVRSINETFNFVVCAFISLAVRVPPDVDIRPFSLLPDKDMKDNLEILSLVATDREGILDHKEYVIHRQDDISKEIEFEEIHYSSVKSFVMDAFWDGVGTGQ